MMLTRVLIAFFFCCTSMSAQDSIAIEEQLIYDTTSNLTPVNFDEAALSAYKKQQAFSYLDVAKNDNWWTRFKQWIHLRYEQFKHWLFGEYPANTVLILLLEFLPYLILFLILAFSIWLFVRLNPGISLLEPPEEPSVFINDEENIVHSEDISKLIEQALKEKDYRLAVRYYYLQLLRQLTGKGLISYEFQKTNSEYLSEIKPEDLKVKFKKLIRIYDFIWYGNFSISETEFETVQVSFQNLQAVINTFPNE